MRGGGDGKKTPKDYRQHDLIVLRVFIKGTGRKGPRRNRKCWAKTTSKKINWRGEESLGAGTHREEGATVGTGTGEGNKPRGKGGKKGIENNKHFEEGSTGPKYEKGYFANAKKAAENNMEKKHQVQARANSKMGKGTIPTITPNAS